MEQVHLKFCFSNKKKLNIGQFYFFPSFFSRWRFPPSLLPLGYSVVFMFCWWPILVTIHISLAAIWRDWSIDHHLIYVQYSRAQSLFLEDSELNSWFWVCTADYCPVTKCPIRSVILFPWESVWCSGKVILKRSEDLFGIFVILNGLLCMGLFLLDMGLSSFKILIRTNFLFLNNIASCIVPFLSSCYTVTTSSLCIVFILES